MSTRKKTIFASLGIFFLILAVQWNGFPALLDGMLGGISWSSGIINFLKQQTQGLLLLIFITLYLEFVGIDSSRKKVRDSESALIELLQASIEKSPASALVEHGLEKLYGTMASKQICQMIIKDCPSIKGFTLRIQVKESDNKYYITLTYSYEATSSPYFVAITDDPFLAESLISIGFLSEIFVIQKKMVEWKSPESPPFSVNCVEFEKGKTKQVGELQFKEVSARRLSSLLRKHGFDSKRNRVTIYEGTHTKFKKNKLKTGVKYQVVNTIEQDNTLPYAFWLSDRVLHVKSMEIDLSELGKEIYSEAKLHFFVAGVDWLTGLNDKNGIWNIPIDRWLISGQGISIIWPSKKSKLYGKRYTCETNN